MRNIWIPKMSRNRLEKLLGKTTLSDNDKEILLDYKYFIENQKIDALSKGLCVELLVSQKEQAIIPAKLWWLPNIVEKTKGFTSQYEM